LLNLDFIIMGFEVGNQIQFLEIKGMLLLEYANKKGTIKKKITFPNNFEPSYHIQLEDKTTILSEWYLSKYSKLVKLHFHYGI